MSYEIDRLIELLRSLEDRVCELERLAYKDVCVVGFEVDVEDEFDEDASEYVGHDPMCRPHRG